jgi:bZIP transcription factor.
MNGGQMQLPAWLQHMNNVATLASQVGSAVSPSSSSASKQMPLSHGQQGLSYVTNQSRMNMNVNIGSHRNIYSGGTHVFPTPDILPIPSNVTAMAHSVFFKDDQALESTEKRQKRLARNRESARQSRRRKKEMLLNLRSQVSRLHNDIEYIRKGKLETMEHDLMVDKFRILNEVFLDQTCIGQSKTGEDKIASVIRNSGPNIAERRAAIEYQYKTLQKAIFPHYRRLILSLSLNDRNFFMDAKEQKAKVRIFHQVESCK